MPRSVLPHLPSGSFGDQPSLEIDDLILRPWSPSDAAGAARAYEDPDIRHWNSAVLSVAEAADWITEQSNLWTQETGASWAITRDNTLIGRMSFRSVSLFTGEAELAYWVVPEVRGNAVATRAARLIVDWAFETGLRRLVLNHSVDNPQSCSVARKLGFALEGIARESVQHSDGWHDMHVHSRLASDV